MEQKYHFVLANIIKGIYCGRYQIKCYYVKYVIIIADTDNELISTGLAGLK